MTQIADLADAIAAAITASAAALPVPIVTVERRWSPDWDQAALRELRCGVIPRTIDRTALTRATDQIDCTVDVALMRHLPGDKNADPGDLDPYVASALAVASLLAGMPLSRLPVAKRITIRHEPVFSQQQWQERRCFFSLISTTWLLTEAVR